MREALEARSRAVQAAAQEAFNAQLEHQHELEHQQELQQQQQQAKQQTQVQAGQGPLTYTANGLVPQAWAPPPLLSPASPPSPYGTAAAWQRPGPAGKAVSLPLMAASGAAGVISSSTELVAGIWKAPRELGAGPHSLGGPSSTGSSMSGSGASSVVGSAGARGAVQSPTGSMAGRAPRSTPLLSDELRVLPRPAALAAVLAAEPSSLSPTAQASDDLSLEGQASSSRAKRQPAGLPAVHEADEEGEEQEAVEQQEEDAASHEAWPVRLVLPREHAVHEAVEAVLEDMVTWVVAELAWDAPGTSETQGAGLEAAAEPKAQEPAATEHGMEEDGWYSQPQQQADQLQEQQALREDEDQQKRAQLEVLLQEIAADEATAGAAAGASPGAPSTGNEQHSAPPTAIEAAEALSAAGITEQDAQFLLNMLAPQEGQADPLLHVGSAGLGSAHTSSRTPSLMWSPEAHPAVSPVRRRPRPHSAAPAPASYHHAPAALLGSPSLASSPLLPKPPTLMNSSSSLEVLSILAPNIQVGTALGASPAARQRYVQSRV